MTKSTVSSVGSWTFAIISVAWVSFYFATLPEIDFEYPSSPTYVLSGEVSPAQCASLEHTVTSVELQQLTALKLLDELTSDTTEGVLAYGRSDLCESE